MVIGERITSSDTVWCTWHGIMETCIYLDSETGTYGITQSGVVVATRDTLEDVVKAYIEMTWKTL